MASQNSQARTLDSFCQNSSCLRVKIALCTFFKVKFPVWIEKSILIFEYLQLMSQGVLSEPFIDQNSEHKILFFEIIIYALKLINPCYLLAYQSSKSTISSTLVIIFCFSWAKFILFIHVVCNAFRNRKTNDWLLAIWRWIYRFQTRVLYFLFSSFWVRAIIEAKENGFRLFGMGEASMIFTSCLMIVADFLFSFTLEPQLCYFLPTKNFLSTKNNRFELATLLQKFIIQSMLLILKSDSEALAWIIPIIGAMMDIVRFYVFFSTLPLYHTNALTSQGSLLSTVLSINLAGFVNIILQSSTYKGASINFMIITWILLALLTNKVSYEALKIQIFSLLTGNSQRKHRPELLLHKVALTKELYRSEKLPTSNTSNYNLGYLVSVLQGLNLQEIFGLENMHFSQDLSDEKRLKKIYLLYYEEFSKKYPKNSLIKLHTAYRSFKNSEPYTKVIKLANEVQKRTWSENYLGSCLLLYEIEKSILDGHKKNKENLDLYTYMKSRMRIDKLRNDMLEQTNLHIKICNNMLSDICDIEEIHHSAQRICHLKTQIQKQIDRLSRNLSEYYISPFLVYAEYHLVANYSKDNFEKYYDIYTQRYYKAQRFLQEPKLQEENLYQGSNALILISTQKNEHGKILYCNQSLVDLCGGQSIKLYEGSNISILFPRILKDYYEDLFRQNEEGSMSTIHRAYLFHKDRHLVEVDFCFKYHPYLTQGLCLTMIVRPVPASQSVEFLLLSVDGDIEGASKKISNQLGLKRISHSTNFPVSIKDVSEELYLVNNALNIASRRENKVFTGATSKVSDWISQFLVSSSLLHAKEKQIPREKAEEIYSVFTLEGQEIHLHPYDATEEKSFTFHSQVQILNYRNIQMKLVTLMKKSKGHDNESKKEVLAPANSQRVFFPSPRILTGEERSLITENFEFEDYGGQTMITEFRQQQSLISPSTIVTDRRHLMGETLATDFSLVQSPQQRRVINAAGATGAASSVHKAGSLLSIFESSMGNHEDGDSKLDKLESVYQQRKIQKYISTQSSPTIRSAERVENKLFKAAIISKSYPRSFTSLCFIFYLVILMTFASQIIMKIVSDTTMKDLQIKKTLLKDSEEVTYKGSWIQLNGVGIMLVIVQLLSAGGTYVSMNDTVTNLQVRISDMKIANDAILDLAHSLDQGTQSYMFQSDVQINGTYLDGTEPTSKYVNIFEVTSEIGNAIRAFTNLANPSSMAGYRIATYFKYNLVNDFQYKGAQITEMLAQSVNEQKESFQYITNLFLILNPFLLTGIGVLLCCIIWNQYRIEKENLRAFVKLPPEGVKMMANRLYQFQKSLSSEEVFAKRWVNVTNTGVYDSRRLDRTSAYSRKFETQKIKYKALRKRYSKYIARVIICISVLVAITIWDLITTRRAIKVIYNRQSQLQYANYISNRVVLTHITVNELFLTNNTLRVAHKIPYEGILELIQTIKEIQSDIPQKFLEVDGTYNPEVKKIIFNDNPTCEGFSETFIHYCYVQVAAGRSTDMMVTLSYYQTLMNQKVNDYVNVDKSSLSKIIAVALASDASLTPAVVLAEEAHRIANIMDQSMTERITKMQNLKIGIIVTFVLGLFVVSVLIWIYILQVIRNVHNDFKRVLQVFPPNLVLSSYLLKRFLQRTSSGAIFREL